MRACVRAPGPDARAGLCARRGVDDEQRAVVRVEEVRGQVQGPGAAGAHQEVPAPRRARPRGRPRALVPLRLGEAARRAGRRSARSATASTRTTTSSSR
eukprot:scaffold489_cov286-Prasinococcus_capsulatus_cf.AAC.1